MTTFTRCFKVITPYENYINEPFVENLKTFCPLGHFKFSNTQAELTTLFVKFPTNMEQLKNVISSLKNKKWDRYEKKLLSAITRTTVSLFKAIYKPKALLLESIRAKPIGVNLAIQCGFIKELNHLGFLEKVCHIIFVKALWQNTADPLLEAFITDYDSYSRIALYNAIKQKKIKIVRQLLSSNLVTDHITDTKALQLAVAQKQRLIAAEIIKTKSFYRNKELQSKAFQIICRSTDSQLLKSVLKIRHQSFENRGVDKAFLKLWEKGYQKQIKVILEKKQVNLTIVYQGVARALLTGHSCLVADLIDDKLLDINAVIQFLLATDFAGPLILPLLTFDKSYGVQKTLIKQIENHQGAILLHCMMKPNVNARECLLKILKQNNPEITEKLRFLIDPLLKKAVHPNFYHNYGSFFFIRFINLESVDFCTQNSELIRYAARLGNWQAVIQIMNAALTTGKPLDTTANNNELLVLASQENRQDVITALSRFTKGI
jgi:hypothetical protein